MKKAALGGVKAPRPPTKQHVGSKGRNFRTNVAADYSAQEEDAKELIQQGKLVEAVGLMDKVLTAKVNRGGSSWGYAERLVVLCNKGACKGIKSNLDHEVSKRFLNKAESTLLTSEAFTGFHPLRICLLSSTLNNRAIYMYRCEADIAAAEELLFKAQETEGASLSPQTLLNLASIHFKLNRIDEAMLCVSQASGISRFYMEQPDLTSSVPAVFETQRAFKEEHCTFYAKAHVVLANLYWWKRRHDMAKEVIRTAASTAVSYLGASHPLSAWIQNEQVNLLNKDADMPPEVPLRLQEFNAHVSPSHLLPYALKAPLPDALTGKEERLKLPKIPNRQVSSSYSIPHDPHRFLRLRDIQQRSAILDRKFFMQQIPVLGKPNKNVEKSHTTPIAPRRPTHWIDDPVDCFARRLQTYNAGEQKRRKSTTQSVTPPMRPHPPMVPKEEAVQPERLSLSDDDWMLYEALRSQASEIVSRNRPESSDKTNKVHEELKRASSITQLSTIVSEYVEATNTTLLDRLYRVVTLYTTVCTIANKWLRCAREAIEARNMLQLTGALLIQKNWRLRIAGISARSTVAVKRTELQLLKCLRSAGTLQRQGRGYTSRLQVYNQKKEVDARRDAALKREHNRAEIAALLIQGLWKGFKVRAVISKWEEAVVVLQRTFRCFRLYVRLKHIATSRRKWRGMHQTMNKAAVVVGRSWTAYRRSKDAKLSLRERHDKLERYFIKKAEADAQQWRDDMARRRQLLALVMQVFARCKLSFLEHRRKVELRDMRTRSANKIAMAWYCKVAHDRVREARAASERVQRMLRRCEQLHECAIEVQRVVRGMLGRKKASHIRSTQNRKVEAVTHIQRMWQGHVGRAIYCRLHSELLERNYQYMQKATKHYNALVIQAAFRAHLSRKQVRLMKSVDTDIHRHAAVLQRFMRMVRARRLYIRLRAVQERDRQEMRMQETQLWACLAIQCCWRYFVARREREARAQRSQHVHYAPACIVQQSLRANTARRRSEAAIESKKRDDVASISQEHLIYYVVTLQKLWRGYVRRSAYRNAKLTGRARLRKGQVWKAYSRRLDHAVATQLRPHKTQTGARFSSLVGATPCRRPTWVNTTEEAVVRQPRSLFIAARNKKMPYLRLVARSEAVRVIESWYWGVRDKVFVASCRRAHLHVVYIKTLWRKGIRKVLDRHKRAAVRIQSVWRRRCVKAKLEIRRCEVRREWVLEYVLPQLMKYGSVDAVRKTGQLDMKEEAVIYAGYSARIIQTAVRRMLCRKMVERHREGIGSMLADYEAAEERIWAATMVQKLYRGHVSRTQQRVQDTAALILQDFRKIILAKIKATDLRCMRAEHIFAMQDSELSEAAAVIQQAWRSHSKSQC